MPALPGLGTTNWMDWAAGIHEAAEVVTEGRLTDASVRAAFVSVLTVADPTAIGTAIVAAVTALPAGGGEIIVPAEDYTAASTISITEDNVTITFRPGATIKPTSAATGTLASSGRIFDIDGRTNVLIQGGTFLPPASLAAFTLTDGDQGTIRISDSVDCTARRNRFLDPAGVCGVTVTGPDSNDNAVVDNYLDGAGILYAYGGACGTRVEGNTIRNSPNNALGGVGNGAQYSERCILARNKIYDAGRMGVEDWGTIRGTKIVHNEIYGTGVDPTFAAANETFGISAVGYASLVAGNTLVDTPGYGIEVAGSGTRVVDNHLRQVAGGLIGTGYGIMVNSGPGAGGPRGAHVGGNEITDFGTSIRLWQDFGVAMLIGNTLENFAAVGVDCDTDDPQSTYVAIGNYLRLSKPVTDGSVRLGLMAYSSTGAGARGVTLSGNRIFYDPAAGIGHNGYEIAIKPITSEMLIEGNVVHGGGIAPNGFPPKLDPLGGTPTGVRILHNTFVGGATIEPGTLVSPVVENNVTAA